MLRKIAQIKDFRNNRSENNGLAQKTLYPSLTYLFPVSSPVRKKRMKLFSPAAKKTAVKRPNLKTISQEIKDEIITAAFKQAAEEAKTEPCSRRLTPQIRWYRTNSNFGTKLAVVIAERYPNNYATQHRRLWVELVLEAFGLLLAGFSRVR